MILYLGTQIPVARMAEMGGMAGAVNRPPQAGMGIAGRSAS